MTNSPGGTATTGAAAQHNLAAAYAGACGCAQCLSAQGTGASPSGANGINTGSSYLDALLAGSSYRWNSGSAFGTAATVTFSFLSAVPSYYAASAGERSNFVALSAAQKQGVRDALAQMSEVANITFNEVSDAGNGGQIRVGTALLPSGVGAWAYYPNQGSIGGDMWLSNRYANNLNMTVGGYGFLTVLHELGHAVGLKHPGNYNAGGGGTEGPYLPSSTDTHQYTVMSYNANSQVGEYANTLMLYDIAALQYLYGANTSTRSGDTTYTVSNSAEEVRTIWDGGGTDAIDASNQSQRAIINLTAGTFSSIGIRTGGTAATNNIGIAYNVTIENAFGGSASDTIRGNDAANDLRGSAGNDSLWGLDGNDVLSGGSDDDKLYGGDGNDTLTGGTGSDLINGGSGTDVAVFSGNRASYTINQVNNALRVVGAGGTTMVSGVESLRFDDQTYAVPASTVPTASDFSGNGAADILWRNTSTGALRVWTLNGANVQSSAAPQLNGSTMSMPAAWRVESVMDLTGDGRSDILWRHSTNGSFRLWEMNGSTVVSASQLQSGGSNLSMGSAWRMEGAGDFGGDGVADLFWRNTSSGALRLWNMNGSTVSSIDFVKSGGSVLSMPSTWQVAGVADFSGDGLVDVLWRQSSTGRMTLWTMEGGEVSASENVTLSGSAVQMPVAGWTVLGVADFTQDGKADVLWRHSSGSLRLWEMDGATLTSSSVLTMNGSSLTMPGAWGVESISDYTGDGKADIVWRNANSGAFRLWEMNGTSVTSIGVVQNAGASAMLASAWQSETSGSLVG